MRLIDADKLPRTNVIDRIDGREVFINQWISASAIDKAPIVDAIPIAWIKREMSMTQELSGRCTYYEALDLLLRNWKEDNSGLDEDGRQRWN